MPWIGKTGSQHAPGRVCETHPGRTGRNEGTAMSIAPKWEKQIDLGQVLFRLLLPLNSFPSVNFLST